MNFENGTVAIVSGIRGNVMNGRTSRSSMRFAWVAIGVALGLTTAGCSGQKSSPASATVAPRIVPPQVAGLNAVGITRLLPTEMSAFGAVSDAPSISFRRKSHGVWRNVPPKRTVCFPPTTHVTLSVNWNVLELLA